MKVILTSLNARFIYSSLSLYTLKSFCQDLGAELLIKEHTINENLLDIAGELFGEGGNVIAFSCYIWNLEETLKVAGMLKKVNPGLFIVFGGPEVSYDPEDFLSKYPFIDCLVYGEGEKTFYELIDRLMDSETGTHTDQGWGNNFTGIAGLVWREGEKIIKNPQRPLISALDDLPFPYGGGALVDFVGKIIYYEASRGCPFTCQYCLSSTCHGVRFFSLPRVKDDLEKMITAGVKQVKFVDRTFNCHPARTREILAFLLTFKGQRINFHFEISGDLLDKETIALMAQAPPGFFQVEIGVQTTNPQVLETIQRKTDLYRLKGGVRQLRNKGNVHIHLDLIAGLPGEDLASLENSFNEVYLLRPHHLQLGFLKLLKGSGLREKAAELGLIYQEHPPYEILETGEMTFAHLAELKQIEEMVEQFHNRDRLRYTLDYLIHRRKVSPFSFFRNLARFWRQYTPEKMLRPARMMRLFYEFLLTSFPEEDKELFHDFLKLDWLLREPRHTLPAWLGGGGGQDRTLELSKFLPWARGLTPREIYKKISLEEFKYCFSLREERVENFRKHKCRALVDYTRAKNEIIFIPAKSNLVK